MIRELISNPRRLFLIALGALGLFAIYFFQHYLDFYHLLQFEPPQEIFYTSDYQDVDAVAFSINKLFRYLFNDLFAMAIIAGLFPEKAYLRFAFFVLLFGLLILSPCYIGLYLWQPAGFSSTIGHLHRLVMNPVLMMLLIPAFFYQKQLLKDSHKKS